MRSVVAATCLACALLLSGCNPDAVSFQATHVLAAPGNPAQNLNDEIALRFSGDLDAASLSIESLRVTDEAGRRVAIKARAVGDVLLIGPADPDGWPAETKLAVEVPHPWLGRPIRSSTGAANGAAFRAEVTTGTRYAPRGGALRLVYHSLPFAGGTDVTSDAEFLFEVDGPVDAESLRDGVVIEDLGRGETPVPVAAVPTTSRRFAVAPFAGGHEFRPGTRYRLTLGTTLRAQDTRRLAAPVSFVFTTTRSRSGEHFTDFRPEHLVVPALRGDRKGPLAPRPMETGQLQIGSGMSAVRSYPFGPDRSRVQILVPGESLQRIVENSSAPLPGALITGVSFKVIGATSSLRLSGRIDYASGAHARSLARSFEENWSLPVPRARDLLGPEGDLQPLMISDDGTLVLIFARPFFYDLTRPESERSLVLELVNESGVLNDSPGILLRGDERAGAAETRFLVSRSDGDVERESFVPAMNVLVQPGYAVVELTPWTVTTVTDPEYFRRADDVVATPGFVSFLVQYRARDEAGDGRDWTPWKNESSELSGHRTIQARIVFLLRSPDPVPKDAGLLRLAVPFRERGD
jgi:hypothetical protein